MATCYSSDALCSDILERRVHTCDQRRVFITQHKDYNVSVPYWHVSSPCAVWLSAIHNRLRLNRVTRKDFVFRVTFNTMCSIIVVFMAVRLHQLVLRTKTMCLRDVFHTNSVVATQIPFCRGSLAACHHYSFTIESRHTQRLCLPCDG